MSLFAADSSPVPPKPLAERMRPRTLDDIYGQAEALTLVKAFIEQGTMPSVVFWGPPGTGKTTISRLLAAMLEWESRSLNATSASVKDIRALAADAKSTWQQFSKRTLLFLDEIHRLNKGQQDVLLPFAEDGTFVLAGSTTENPSFYLNHALRSRVQLIRLVPLTPADIQKGLHRAVQTMDAACHPAAIQWIADRVSGDLRTAFTVLESAYLLALSKERGIELEDVRLCFDRALVAGDRSGDNHYDLASAYQKSMRGSDVNAAMYYLGRFLASGEDPRFIARRLLVTASEDVGNADPQAFVIASHAFSAVERLGLPEARIPLAQATIYVASAPKSNQSVAALGLVDRFLANHPVEPVPAHLRDAHYAGAKALGHGVGYMYSHNNPGGSQVFLPEGAAGQQFVPAPTAQTADDAFSGDDLAVLLTGLRTHFSGQEWFDLQVEQLADALSWPIAKVRAGVNRLVQSKRLHFKRSFKLQSPDDSGP